MRQSFTERMQAGKDAAVQRRYREGTAGGGKMYDWSRRERPVSEQEAGCPFEALIQRAEFRRIEGNEALEWRFKLMRDEWQEFTYAVPF